MIKVNQVYKRTLTGVKYVVCSVDDSTCVVSVCQVGNTRKINISKLLNTKLYTFIGNSSAMAMDKIN